MERRDAAGALGRGAVLALLVCACRAERPGGAGGTDAMVTAHTLGLAYLRQNQLAEAERAFRQVVAAAPDQPIGYANLGLTYLRAGRYPDAERQIERALARDSANGQVRLMLAQTYALTGREREARVEAEEVLRRDSTNVQALYALAQLAAQSRDPGDRPRREAYLRRLVDRAPANVAARLELVQVLLDRGDADGALGQLETLRQRLPELGRETAPSFARTLELAREGRPAEAAEAFGRFRHFMEVTGVYQAGFEQLRAAGGALVGYPVLTVNQNLTVPKLGPREFAAAIRFADVTEPAGLSVVPPFPDSLARAREAGAALAVGDYDGDGAEDLFVTAWSLTEHRLVGHLLHNELGKFVERTVPTRFARGADPVAAAFADYDNDGRLDLFVATTAGGLLLRNPGDGRFADVTRSAGLAAGPPAQQAAFLDLDQDGDLDLYLSSLAGDRVYRNNLDGTFRTLAAPSRAGGGPLASQEVVVGDFDGDGLVDLVAASPEASLTLLRNVGGGNFTDATAPSGLVASRGSRAVAAGDYDNDGSLDLFVTAADGGPPTLYRNRGDGTFQPDRRSPALARALRGVAALGAAFFDFDNDGFLDLVVVGLPTQPGARGVVLFRNDGSGRFEEFSRVLPADLTAGRRVAALDYDADGALDLVVVDGEGRVRLLHNDGASLNQYVQVRLVALRTGSGKNNDFGVGATLELRAGNLYQMRVVTDPVTHFGLGRHLKADVLRVQWPNGVPQTIYYPGTEADVLEQQVLKGSCPFLYAWDGTAYTFVTDVMWRSALGMPLGIMGEAPTYGPPDASEEYVRLPGALLKPRAGRYTLQVTEELWETAYVDQVKLLAVDHPDSVEVYVDERFVPPGPAALRLYRVVRPRPPVSATDGQGNELLPPLRATDDVYASNLVPTRYQGLTELHDLVLDLGDPAGMDSVFLFLRGWIFPTDASINTAISQSRAVTIVPPSLAVRDAAGRWRTVIPDIGFPSGKDKTVIVNLTGKLPSGDHRVRIRTNMAIYWDQVFVAGDAWRSPVTITTLEPVAADLHYRGFSRMYRKGGRYGPQWFAYGDVSAEQRWLPIAGSYTRYGDVLPLLGESDDMYAIMGPGDEMSVGFDATRPPPLPPRWRRDFVLYTDSWLKDADMNTAGRGTVLPLPFHGMSRYPYGPGEPYPTDPVHRHYLETYDTRRVSRAAPARADVSATSAR